MDSKAGPRRYEGGGCCPPVERDVRAHGNQRPYHPFQVATWVLVPLILGGFYGLALPILEDELKFIAVPYFILNVISVYCAVQVSGSDPADPRVLVNKRYQKRAGAPDGDPRRPIPLTCLPCERIPSPDPRLEDQAGIYYCIYCQVHVSNLSYHCSYCCKCVHRLDHHCHWLNNCIGSLNYKYFFGVLLSTLLFTTMQLVVLTILLWRYFSKSYYPGFRDHVDKVFVIPHEAFVALVIMYAVLLVPVVVSIAQLFHFHLVLNFKNMTTLEYVRYASGTGASSDSPKRKPKPAPTITTTREELEQEENLELGSQEDVVDKGDDGAHGNNSDARTIGSVAANSDGELVAAPGDRI